MQNLLVESPDLIPGVGPAVAVDELFLPDVGSVDIVVLDPSGALTLVECKLAANSEIRRAVVGQILAYAAGVWKLTYEQLDERFRQRAGLSLIEAIAPVAERDSPDWEAEDFRQSVAEALDRGAFRLVVAVDQITEELKGIVEYLNTHTVSEVEVLALELGYVIDGDVEILLPRTHGQESARVRRSVASGKRPFWKVEDVFSHLAELATPEEVRAIRQLYDNVLERGGKIQPGRGSYPTMSAYMTFGGDLRTVWAVYADPSGPTAPRISLNFGSWTKNLTDEQLAGVLSQLETVPALAGHLTGVRESGFSTYPTIPLPVLVERDVVEAITTALEPYTAGI